MGPMGMMPARFGPREGTAPTRDPEAKAPLATSTAPVALQQSRILQTSPHPYLHKLDCQPFAAARSKNPVLNRRCPVLNRHCPVLFRPRQSSRTLGEQVMADLLEIALSDLWVIEQCPVHNRFPDFFVPAFNLVIEVDGGYHRNGSPRHRLDWYKDWALTKRGFNVFHIENQVLVENCWLALSELRAFIERLLEPISSSGNFCPWGWTYYLQCEQSEKEVFSLSNPQDLASIRWEISVRFPKPEQCPSNWCVPVREEAFKTEAKILDLENQEYECEPGSDGNYIFPRHCRPTD